MKLGNLKRYKKWLIIWITFIVLFSIALLLNAPLLDSINLYTIYTQNFMVDLVLIFLLIPILSIVAYFIGGYIFSPLLIYLHKKIFGRSLIYGIEELDRPRKFKGAFLKSFFPALMALNIAILLSDEIFIHNIIFSSTTQSLPPAVLSILTMIILFPLASAIGIALFSAIFFLTDSGIEYSNKKHKKVLNNAYPTELRSVGTYYLYFLKGYAGITVIINLIQVISSFLNSIQVAGSSIYLINLFFWPFMPFVIAFFMVPVVIIQDITYDKRNKFVRKWAGKFGISGRIQDPLDRDTIDN